MRGRAARDDCASGTVSRPLAAKVRELVLRVCYGSGVVGGSLWEMYVPLCGGNMCGPQHSNHTSSFPLEVVLLSNALTHSPFHPAPPSLHVCMWGPLHPAHLTEALARAASVAAVANPAAPLAAAAGARGTARVVAVVVVDGQVVHPCPPSPLGRQPCLPGHGAWAHPRGWVSP